MRARILVVVAAVASITFGASGQSPNVRSRAVRPTRAVAPATWQWRVEIFGSFPVAAAFAASQAAGTIPDNAPIVVPTSDARPRFIVFYKVFADLVFVDRSSVAFSVYPDVERAFEDWRFRWVYNKGMVTAADRSVIVWNVVPTWP